MKFILSLLVLMWTNWTVFGNCNSLFDLSLRTTRILEERDGFFEGNRSRNGPDVIFGGEPIQRGLWTSAIALTSSSGGAFCTGTALTPTVIITAAHCINQQISTFISDVKIHVGEGQSGGQFAGQYSLKSVTVHPKFSRITPERFDFAILTLNSPITQGEVEYLKLLPASLNPLEFLAKDTPVHLVGFGTTENQEFGTKRGVHTKVTGVLAQGATEIFIGGNGQDTCQGDSGGPAYVKISEQWFFFGVTSRGGVCGEGGVYGLAGSVRDWIESTIGFQLP